MIINDEHNTRELNQIPFGGVFSYGRDYFIRSQKRDDNQAKEPNFLCVKLADGEVEWFKYRDKVNYCPKAEINIDG